MSPDRPTADAQERVAAEARAVAEAWSAPGSPPSWRLTASVFRALAEDRALLDLAAAVPPERHPALLFVAASRRLIARHRPPALDPAFPRAGAPQPPLEPGFAADYRAFLLRHGAELSALLAGHRYQMNEVGRCAQVAPALGRAAARHPGRDAVLVDVGTGAGLGLRPDRCAYRYLRTDGGDLRYGPADAALVLESRLVGDLDPPLSPPMPRIVDRVGIELDPVDLGDAEAVAWLAACVPPEAGAVERFASALDLARSEPAGIVVGDACSALPEVLAAVPPGPLVVVVDSYVDVFFPEPERRRFGEIVDASGAGRDLAWISLDPLVPLGPEARESVQGIPVPDDLVRRSREEGLFGVLGLVEWHGGRRSEALLGCGHPGGSWMEWLEPPGSRP